MNLITTFNFRKILIFSILCFLTDLSLAQVNYTANDKVLSHDGSLRFGINMGYYPNFTNEDLGNISAGNASLGIKGVGVKSARPSLSQENFDNFGYNFLVGLLKVITNKASVK